jgi:hypothetical protein
MSYDNTNSGTLGKNRNPKSNKSPDLTGKINAGGEDFWISAWLKEDFLSDDMYIAMLVNPANERECKSTGKLEKNRTQRGRQPDYKGILCIDSVDYDLVAWTRSSDNGKFLSIKVESGTQNHEPAPAPSAQRPLAGDPKPKPQQQAPSMDFDDDIPF